MKHKRMVTSGKRVGARASKCKPPKRDRYSFTGALEYRAPKRIDKLQADDALIPQSLRRYAKRYRVSVDAIIRMDKRINHV